MTPNDKLPVDVRKNIWAEAERYAEEKVKAVNEEHFNVYNAHIAGATAWAKWKVKHDELQAQAQRMADALEFIANSPVPANEREMVSWILTARALAVEQLQQFKDGGKEVGKPIVIEYMPILSAELRELKDIRDVPMRVPMHLLNERQAYSNHGQSLQRLKERGGLSVKESLALINCMPWMHYKYLPINEAVLLLNELITNPTK